MARSTSSVNCVDRHLAGARRNKAAIVWEGEPGDHRTLTYWELYRECAKFANVLKKLGVVRGDRVGIYLPLIPEVAIAMLACARIGAIHSVVFGGFSPDSLRDRMNDAQAKVVITADAGYRRGQIVPLKRNTDQAVDEAPSVKHVIVVQRRTVGPIGEAYIEMQEGRDHWYHRLMQERHRQVRAGDRWTRRTCCSSCTRRARRASPRASCTRPAATSPASRRRCSTVFDLREDDVFWCTADVGWVTGHSYLVYGPLANGATCVMYEGAPDWPERSRFWEVCERHGVTVFYTAPTAIRAFMKWGDAHPARHDLSRLRLLGTVGEPINPEAWMWYHKVIGGERCPDRGHVVADGDGRHRHLTTPRPHRDKAGERDEAVAGVFRRAARATRASASRWAAACSPSRSRGRRCCAPSGATTRATWRRTSRSGPGDTTSTSPATAPSVTTTAISGSLAASTTC